MEIFRLGLEVLMLFNLFSATEEIIMHVMQHGSWLQQEMGFPRRNQDLLRVVPE